MRGHIRRLRRRTRRRGRVRQSRVRHGMMLVPTDQQAYVFGSRRSGARVFASEHSLAVLYARLVMLTSGGSDGISEIGPFSAAQFAESSTLGHLVRRAGPPLRLHIGNPKDVADLVFAEMTPLAQEQLRVLCLDIKQHIIDLVTVYQGTLSGSLVRPAEVFRPAVVCSAAAIIVVHNHPSGDPTPSPDDIRTTELLRRAGEMDI
jgi:DNA repair protein RadC